MASFRRSVQQCALALLLKTSCTVDFDVQTLPSQDAGLRSSMHLAPTDSGDSPNVPACPEGTTLCNSTCVALESNPQHCGRCDRACATDERCIAGRCLPQCTPDQTLCGTTCRDLRRDVSHCGQCNSPCPIPANGTPICQNGTCHTLCNPGFGDCDDLPTNGCETDLTTSVAHCGACHRICPSGPQATPLCAAGRCTLRCTTGYADCNNDPTDGCETDLSNDPDHCGRCGNACLRTANTVAWCEAGSCQSTCMPGFADCDGVTSNGCEASLDGVANCGRCGVRCEGATPICATEGDTRTCTSGCSIDTRLCSGSCVDTQTDPDHCGGCNVVCPAAPHSRRTCSAGLCGFVCDPGYASCDGNSANGCETDLATSVSNCGSCGRVCSAGPNSIAVCNSGRCNLVCTAGYANCDGDLDNGCETPIGSDPNHCGGCGVTCTLLPHTRATCNSGRCTLTCASPWEDCNGQASDGCEIDLSSDPRHCGTCGQACPAPARCVLGTCVS